MKLTENELQIKNDYWNTTMALANMEDNWDGGHIKGSHYISVSKSQWKNAFDYSLARKIENERAGIIDRGFSNDMKISEIVGMISEIVVADAFGVEWDHTTAPRGGGADCIIDGHTIDIKSCKPCRNDSDYVIAAQTKTLQDADMYFATKLLKYNSESFICLYGYCRNDEMIDDSNKVDWADGYWLPKEKLSKFKNYDRIK